MGYVGTYGLKLLIDGYTYKEGSVPHQLGSGSARGQHCPVSGEAAKIATDFIVRWLKYFDAPGAP